jgi:hypothetical protein
MSNTPITHKLEIDNGGAILLRDLLARPEWYKGQPFRVGLAANDVAERLSDLKEPRPTDEDKIGQTHVRPEFVDRVKEWNAVAYVLEVSEPEREALKKVFRFNWEHGVLANSRHVAKIGRALGLDQE